ncbi:MAG: hypothetical protein IK136_00080 [Oscillospiraceae bacterium]|nr:hypothetical protein [Oscillospiraceae bacterium]
MLGKLLKHEFRATARVMLPLYGAVLILAVLANLSFAFVEATDSLFLHILCIFFIVVFFIGVVGAFVLTIVVMVGRFYRNLLKNQGYLMHTLPVTAHGHIWSKLIVSLVWFAATAVFIGIVFLLTGLIQTNTSIGDILAGLPSWAEIREFLTESGILGQSALVSSELIAIIIAECLVLCLHFYAALALGHACTKSKVLLSIVFFVAISVVFSVLENACAIGFIAADYAIMEGVEHLSAILGVALIIQIVEGVALYIATWLGLKKGLNLE